MSAELSSQAEAKFLALMDSMASASREAASLRESWSRIMSEREDFNAEREQLMEQVTEVSEELEQKSSDRHTHGEELMQRKKQVEGLLAELSVAMTSVSTEKKRVVDRDLEIQKGLDELRLVNESASRTKIDYERVRAEYETLELTLRTAQADRDGAREEAERHQRELHKVTREKTDITSRLTDITSSHDLSRKEVLTLTDRLKIYDLEREESFQEMDRLKEDARRHRVRADESSKELVDVNEKYERANRDVHKLREVVRVVETERDEHAHTIEHKNRELKTITTSRDEFQERQIELTTKYDHIKRELLSAKDNLRSVELERNEHLENVDRTREQYRLVVLERDEFKEELSNTRRRADDNYRQITLLTETLRKTEQTLSEMRSEALQLIERTKLVERERDDWRGRHGGVATELTELTQRLIVIQGQFRDMTHAHDRVSRELQRRNEEFEEITETITSGQDDSAELEFEIESLRTLLRETREQKERAIAARNAADRERDESVIKFEEKCRELERFEEASASHFHMHGRSSGGAATTTTSSRRMVSSGGASSSMNAIS